MNQTKVRDKVYDPEKTWFFSDPHFDHNNVLRFEQGLHDFQSIEEHDAAIIEKWNSVVKEDDTVFFLGDASMPRIKLHYLKWIFSQLKGQIVWLKGNHDTHVGEEWRKELCEAANIVEFKDYAEISMLDPTANHGTRKIVLFHYPILEFNGKFHGAFHLYGHSHQTVHPIKNAYSVCACITGYGPVNFEWVKEKIQKHNEGLDRPGEPDVQPSNI